MMGFNEIYAFLKNKLYSTNNIVKQAAIHKKTDINNNHYVMYALDATEEATRVDFGNKTYNLENHHLSFYQMQDDSKPYLSQYHYTATLKDKDHKRFTSHVYFDAQDQIVDITLMSPNKDEKITLDDEDKLELAELARINSKNIMAELRYQAQVSYDQLEQKYEKMESELALLSVSIDQNRDQYEQVLHEICKIVELLIPYHPQYESINRLFTHIQNAMTRKPHVSTLTLQRSPHADEVISSSIQIQDAIPTLQKNTLDDKLKSILVAKAAYIKSVEEKLPEVEQTQLALQFFEASNDTALIFNETKSSMDLQTLLTIQKLVSESSHIIKRIMISVIEETKVNSEFDLLPMQMLSNFIPQLSPRFIIHAVRNNNHYLLEILLKYGKFGIDTLLIDGVPLAVYCVLNHTSTVSREKCLSALIEHNASLLVNAPDGLPLVHQILKNPSSDLYKMLVKHNKKILQPKYYAMLSKILQARLAQSNFDEDKRKILNESIAAYRNAIVSINNIPANHIKRNNVLETVASTTAKLLSRLNDEKEKSLLEDPEFSTRAEQMLTLNKKLSSLFKASKNKLKVVDVNDDNTRLDQIPPASSTQEMRKIYLDYQDEYIKTLQLTINKIEIGQQIKAKSIDSKELLGSLEEINFDIKLARINMRKLTLKSQGLSDELPEEKHLDIPFVAMRTQQILDDYKKHDRTSKRTKSKASNHVLTKDERKEKLEEIIALYNQLGLEKAKKIMSWLGTILFKKNSTYGSHFEFFASLNSEDLLDIAVIGEILSGPQERIVDINDETFLIKIENNQGVSIEVITTNFPKGLLDPKYVASYPAMPSNKMRSG